MGRKSKNQVAAVIETEVVEVTKLELVPPTKDESLSQLEALQEELRTKKALAKQGVKDNEFYAKYSHVIPGSVRNPNLQDTTVLKHVHGKVCDIQCQNCPKTRVVNKQDAFQVKYCTDCRGEVKKSIAKEKRQAEALPRSKEKLEAELVKVKAQLESMNAA